MGSVGTYDDSTGQRIVSLKVFVDGFFDGCCHCTWSWGSQNATKHDSVEGFRRAGRIDKNYTKDADVGLRETLKKSL